MAAGRVLSRSAISLMLLLILLPFYRWNTVLDKGLSSFTDNDRFNEKICPCIYRVAETDKHHKLSKGYFTTRISRYPNSAHTFRLKRLSTSGDVSLNPGSEQCATCTKTLAKNHRKLRCNSSSGLHHIKCGHVKPTEFKRQFQSTETSWTCPQCVTKTLLAELLMAGVGNTSFESLFLGEGEENFCITNSFSETHNEQHANDPSSCILAKRQKKNGGLLIMHLNINSLQNKFEELKILINDFKAQVVFLTETKIDSSYPRSQFMLDGYKIFRNDRTKTWWRSISISFLTLSFQET